MPLTATPQKAIHNARGGNARCSISSDGTLTAGSVTSSASAGAMPMPASIMVCTMGISAAVGITNRQPAMAISITQNSVFPTAPSACGNSQTRAAASSSTATM
ncbi:hypothetical protein N172_03900 [Pantoea dispersa EGD-AAK13]|nr:hypothetical protein N172_03900 [Pantoea dispersa EGD-AAK13]